MRQCKVARTQRANRNNLNIIFLMLYHANNKESKELSYFAIGRERRNTTSIMNSQLRVVLK
jgi:hypothetical protein